MKELVIRCSDETYEALFDYDKNSGQCISIQNAIRMYPWLEDLLLASQSAVKRAEILKHNKSLSHVLEINWLKQDCERYGTTSEIFIESIALGHPLRTVQNVGDSDLCGIPKNDPEYNYIQETKRKKEAVG